MVKKKATSTRRRVKCPRCRLNLEQFFDHHIGIELRRAIPGEKYAARACPKCGTLLVPLRSANPLDDIQLTWIAEWDVPTQLTRLVDDPQTPKGLWKAIQKAIGQVETSGVVTRETKDEVLGLYSAFVTGRLK